MQSPIAKLLAGDRRYPWVDGRPRRRARLLQYRDKSADTGRPPRPGSTIKSSATITARHLIINDDLALAASSRWVGISAGEDGSLASARQQSASHAIIGRHWPTPAWEFAEQGQETQGHLHRLRTLLPVVTKPRTPAPRRCYCEQRVKFSICHSSHLAGVTLHERPRKLISLGASLLAPWSWPFGASSPPGRTSYARGFKTQLFQTL